ncbi:hypothetical protein TIFTF001_027281 [Ficus carica]|uniref:Uncharacterized protein n=1 Tax=Ficus carica TaxID=3494 RepID=A0AA88DMX4_FICCA|nr:hypothetical protein TIFTF001_027281 [Ficus carica]
MMAAEVNLEINSQIENPYQSFHDIMLILPTLPCIPIALFTTYLSAINSYTSIGVLRLCNSK